MWTRRIVNLLVAITVAGGIMIRGGCEKMPANSDPKDKQLFPALASASASGSKLYQTVSSLKTAELMMQGAAAYQRGSTPNIGGIQQGMRLTKLTVTKMHRRLKQGTQSLSKTLLPTGERVLWDLKWRDEEKQISYHAVLFFDDQTGRARAYQVGYNFGAQYDLAYDSTHFEFDLNHTLEDSTFAIYHAIFYPDKRAVIDISIYASKHTYDNGYEAISCSLAVGIIVVKYKKICYISIRKNQSSQ